MKTQGMENARNGKCKEQKMQVLICTYAGVRKCNYREFRLRNVKHLITKIPICFMQIFSPNHLYNDARHCTRLLGEKPHHRDDHVHVYSDRNRTIETIAHTTRSTPYTSTRRETAPQRRSRTRLLGQKLHHRDDRTHDTLDTVPSTLGMYRISGSG